MSLQLNSDFHHFAQVFINFATEPQKSSQSTVAAPRGSYQPPHLPIWALTGTLLRGVVPWLLLEFILKGQRSPLALEELGVRLLAAKSFLSFISSWKCLFPNNQQPGRLFPVDFWGVPPMWLTLCQAREGPTSSWRAWMNPESNLRRFGVVRDCPFLNISLYFEGNWGSQG